MRILFVIPHFFSAPKPGQPMAGGSHFDMVARIAALNTAIVALHRLFGPRRHAMAPDIPFPDRVGPTRVVDIVIIQIPGMELLDHIDIDPSCYVRENFSGDAPMMEFEAQRILRDRVGGYDYYGIIEDDIVLTDPTFFDKVQWFQDNFGPDTVLVPARYEMAHSGTPAAVLIDPTLPSELLEPFRRSGQQEMVSARWHGRPQDFSLAYNPHSAAHFLTDEHLRRWIRSPYFYDRDASWVGPMESAMDLSLGRTFDLYKPSAPDPLFLSVEHFGTRYSERSAPIGMRYGDSPILDLAFRANSTNDELSRVKFYDALREQRSLKLELSTLEILVQSYSRHIAEPYFRN